MNDDDSADSKAISSIFATIAPIIKQYSKDKTSVKRFVFYLLVISSAIAEELGIKKGEFKTLAEEAFDAGKDTNKLNRFTN